MRKLSLKKWVLIEEWDEGQKRRVTAYGQMSSKETGILKEEMEMYSPYDYCDLSEYDTQEEYEAYMKRIWDEGLTDNILHCEKRQK